jgi:tRNA(Ile)-lysidine synthase
MKSTLELQVRRTLRKFRMIGRGEHVLAAVSGGADSVALLVCLKALAEEMELKLTVAHLNHMLRAAESDADEEFVRATCAELAAPLIVERRDLRRERNNLEQAARLVRYRFLEEAASRCGAEKIAVGHNRQDQAETVLLNLFRGSGVEGLAGIRPIMGRIVRPLIECTREQILAYLAERGFGCREDSSNTELAFRRNRLRRELIPYVQSHFNPKIVDVLAREAELFRRTAEYLDLESGREYRRIKAPGDKLPLAELTALHPALQAWVIRRALRECRGDLRRITSTQIERILRLCQPGRGGRRVELPGEIAAVRDFQNLVFAPEAPEAPPFCHELMVPGVCTVPEVGLELRAAIADGGASPALDRDAVGGRMIVRSRRPGDRYGGGRKVKKMLIDAKIPRRSRERLPMIVCRDTVAWIPGFEPPRAFAAKPGKPAVLIQIRTI